VQEGIVASKELSVIDEFVRNTDKEQIPEELLVVRKDTRSLFQLRHSWAGFINFDLEITNCIGGRDETIIIFINLHPQRPRENCPEPCLSRFTYEDAN
jgi:hypothetical protein